jgi:lysophospholipase
MKKLLVSLLIVMAVVPLAAVDEARLHAAYKAEIMPYVEANSTTGKLTVSDGTVLSYRALVRPRTRPILILLGGHTESYLKYAELLYDLRHTEMSVYALDQRGQGFSSRPLADPDKDHVDDYESYLSDLESFITTVIKPAEHDAVYLLAHSFGAAVAAAYTERHPETIAGLILSSPYLGLKAGPLAAGFVGMLAAFGRAEDYVPGGGPYAAVAFEENLETHSRVRHERKVQDYEDYPAIRLGHPTNHWIRELEKLAREVIRNAKDIICPTIVFQAEIDEYAHRGAQNRFCARVADCTKVVLEGAYHEILIETDSIREEVLREILGFIEG